jgi:hypothetical protein
MSAVTAWNGIGIERLEARASGMSTCVTSLRSFISNPAGI